MRPYRFVSWQEIARDRFPIHDGYNLVMEGLDLHSRSGDEMPTKQGDRTRSRCFMQAIPAHLPTKDLAGMAIFDIWSDST